MIGAVLFDLDDTLFAQSQFLMGAWADVAAHGAAFGVDEEQLREALHTIAAEGSDRGRIIDRALEKCGASDVPVEPLVQAFRSHSPRHLEPYPGVREAFARLASRVPVGIVTDGDAKIQRAKLHALDLRVRAFVVSDEIGREFRKPHPFAFKRAAVMLRVRADECVFVGDRPDKDIAGAAAVGMRTVRVATGEYAEQPDDPEPWRRAPSAAHAAEMLFAMLPAQESAAG